jgi:hypothetical protein
MRRALSILLLLSLGCGSAPATRPKTIRQPDMTARLVNPLFFGSGNEANATIELIVENRANVPIVVRRIELDSPGMGQYTLRQSVREFRETIGPGETKGLTTWATAVAQTTRRPTEPLVLRAIVEFNGPAGEVWREILMLR